MTARLRHRLHRQPNGFAGFVAVQVVRGAYHLARLPYEHGRVPDLKEPAAACRHRTLGIHGKHDSFAQVHRLLKRDFVLIESTKPVPEEGAYIREARVPAKPPKRDVPDRLRTEKDHEGFEVTTAGSFEGPTGELKRAGRHMPLRHRPPSIPQAVGGISAHRTGGEDGFVCPTRSGRRRYECKVRADILVSAVTPANGDLVARDLPPLPNKLPPRR